MRHFKDPTGNDIFQCVEFNRYAEIKVKDGEIIKACGGNQELEKDEFEFTENVLALILKMSVTCFCEIVSLLKKGTAEYNFAIKLLKDYKEDTEKALATVKQTLDLVK